MSARELVIAFSVDTPPYVVDHARSGIEIEILREALRPHGYTFAVRQMPYGELVDAVARTGVDAAATVIQRDDGT
jgi:polar amino acid transport system substrate-binding protein